MRFDQCTETCTTDCGHCKGQPVAALRADNERLRAEAAFWQDQQKFAANVAAGIADLDEEAPALRQMLRVERGRRKDAEEESDRRGYRLERQRPVIEAARAYAKRYRLFHSVDQENLAAIPSLADSVRFKLIAALDALDGAPGEATP